MSSGWVRDPILAAPLPPGWKLCFSSVPKASCRTVSPLLEALALGELVLVHPAVPSRPAAATAAPSQAAVRGLKMFTDQAVCDRSDILLSYLGVKRRRLTAHSEKGTISYNSGQRVLNQGQRFRAIQGRDTGHSAFARAAPWVEPTDRK